jgi:1-aminocyclopropane-1-carboxylate deaminase/D-cysteine desulfhydrase-like pyridoxal-dependent ACC family enzyme
VFAGKARISAYDSFDHTSEETAMPRLPLTERYPGLAAVPRVDLVDAPTPVERLTPDDDVPLVRVWVKRDDLTSPLYGGNKVRKLEFLLGEAREKGCKSVITFGAYGSNHALATAVHANALGLETHVILSPQPPGPFAARTLRAHAGLGTHLHVVEGWDGKRDAVEVRRALAEKDGVEPAVLPMGGTNALGALGFVNAAFEVLEQGRGSAMHEPGLVYVAGGTLGTAVGLAIGFAAAGAATKVVAVRVTPEEIGSDAVASELVSATVGQVRSLDPGFPELRMNDVNLDLRHDWFEPGYGVPTPETTEAVTVAAARHLKLETTYTGKAFAAMLGDARSGGLDPEASVLFWDTYTSAPLPPEGDDAVLPQVLQAYVQVCDQLYGRGSVDRAGDALPMSGDRE